MKKTILGVIFFSTIFSLHSHASQNTLDDLLLKVSASQQKNRHVEAKRNKDFSADLSLWQQKLKKAEQRLALAKQGATEKGIAFTDNEKQLQVLEAELSLNKESLGELFGVVRQVSSDFLTQIEGSVISTQYPQRNAFVHDLATRKKLPSLTELEQLWFVLVQDMTESTKVAQFLTKTLDVQGVASEKSVIRFGAFNLVDEQQYLIVNAESELPQPLARPVSGDIKTSLKNWRESSHESIQPFYFDPARGELLTVLSHTPTWQERARQGGLIGYIIGVILLVGLVIAGLRFIVLSNESVKIKQQLKQVKANPNNALGRIFEIYQSNKQQSIQVLELKLEEAVLREMPKLERGSSVLKILAAIAPMMGLLGTVTGMIGTFQSITLFGTGDPKLMAGGISMALITTVMGLIAALPLLLIHSLLHSRANALINIIEQQSAGLIAQQAEEEAKSNVLVIDAIIPKSHCA